MKLSPEDGRFLRGAGITLLACLLLGAGGVASAYLYWQNALREHKAATSQQKETRRRLAQASSEEIELKEKISRYLALKQQGIIGAERRLDWVEQIAGIRRELKLPDLAYDLSAQHPVERVLLPAGAQAGGHRFVTSTLHFTTSLLHEGDLTGILAQMQQKLAAQVSTRDCRLSRRDDDARSASVAYTLRAECTVELVTVKESAP